MTVSTSILRRAISKGHGVVSYSRPDVHKATYVMESLVYRFTQNAFRTYFRYPGRSFSARVM